MRSRELSIRYRGAELTLPEQVDTVVALSRSIQSPRLTWPKSAIITLPVATQTFALELTAWPQW